VDRDISVIHTKYIKNDAKLQAIDKNLEARTLVVSLKQYFNIFEVKATTRNGGVNVATWSRNLGIGLEAAKGMRVVTNQRG
jgi:hypothetical protein